MTSGFRRIISGILAFIMISACMTLTPYAAGSGSDCLVVRFDSAFFGVAAGKDNTLAGNRKILASAQVKYMYCGSEDALLLTNTAGNDPQISLDIPDAKGYTYYNLVYRIPYSNTYHKPSDPNYSYSGGEGFYTQLFWGIDGAGYNGSAQNKLEQTFCDYKYRCHTGRIPGASQYTVINKVRIDPFGTNMGAAVAEGDQLYAYALVLGKTESAADEEASRLVREADGILGGADGLPGYPVKSAASPLNTNAYIRNYSTETAMNASFRNGRIVYNESVMPLYSADGTLEPIQLMYDIDRIVCVGSYVDNVWNEYRYGRDYTVTDDGKLRIPAGSTIPVPFLYGNGGWALYATDQNAINTADGTYGGCMWWASTISGKHCFARIADGTSPSGKNNDTRRFFPNWQISVTYTHDEDSENTSWSFDNLKARTKAGYALDGTYEKLKNSSANIVFTGDSITFGWNSTYAAANVASWYSGAVNANVHVMGYPYPTLVQHELNLMYGANHASVYNLAVSGTTSYWLTDPLNISSVLACNPDLIVIAYGMNDLDKVLPLEGQPAGAYPHMSLASEYKANIKGMIDAALAKNPGCEFILVSSILSNELLDVRAGDAERRVQYLEALNELADEYPSAAVFDMMTLHENLIARKGGAAGAASMTDDQFAVGYASLTGSNVHHVNDFMMRMYAQSICEMLGAPVDIPDEPDEPDEPYVPDEPDVPGEPGEPVSSGVITYDLGTASAAGYFSSANNIVCAYNASEGSMQLAATGAGDPHVAFNLPDSVSADAYKYIAVTYRLPVSNSGHGGKTQFFFCADGQGASESRSRMYTLAPSYTYKTEITDLSGESWWKGNIDKIRIDPFTDGTGVWDTLYINSISLFCTKSEAEAAAASLNAKADGAVSAIENFEEKAAKKVYDVAIYSEPVWEGNIVYHESCLPLLNSDGTMSPISLMYDIDRVISVRNAANTVEYKYGRDYTVENGKLVVRTANNGGMINTPAYSAIYSKTSGGMGWWLSKNKDCYIFAQDIDKFYNMQIVVTYTHSDAWDYHRQSDSTSILENSIEKLSSGSPMNVLFCGDSITEGYETSGFFGGSPYTPIWARLTFDSLAYEFGNNNLTYINSAVGGKTSEWCLSDVYDNVIRFAPDLCFLAFGINDASMSRPAADFRYNIRESVRRIKAACPDCDIVLVSTIILNPEIQDSADLVHEYLDAYKDIAAEFDGVAICNITDLHISLLGTKRYFDFSGDNIHHINDFQSRLYAQSALSLFTGTGTETACDTFKVSADRVYGADGETNIAASGGNDSKGTALGSITDSRITAYGWFASSKSIKSFGYRYGDNVVLGSAKYATEPAVLNAGRRYNGNYGQTSRFRIEIPVDENENEVFAVAQLGDGSVVDIWKLTYDYNRPAPSAVRMKVSADQVFAADGRSNLAKVGNNNASGTDLGNIVTDYIIAHGWLGCSVGITRFGYRYGDNAVVNSAKSATESAVIRAARNDVGEDAHASRFDVKVPVDKNRSEVIIVAELSDGRVIDMWKITYSVKTSAPEEPAALKYKISADQVFAADGVTNIAKFGGNDPSGTALGEISHDTIALYGWYACSKPAVRFGYRYGDNYVISSAPAATEAAVTAAGAAYAGNTGSTNRFKVYIPVNSDYNEVWAVAQFADGTTADMWRVTYTRKGTPSTPEEPIHTDLKYKVSADQIFASDGKTNIAKFGGNDASGTALGTVSDKSIIVYGWLASSVSISKFGYRYGNDKVISSSKYTTTAEVIAAGAAYAGSTGSTSRFSIRIPLDSEENEVWAVAQLSDGTVLDMWRITYTLPSSEMGIAGEYLYAEGASPGTGWWFNPISGNEHIEISFRTSVSFSGIDTYVFGNNTFYTELCDSEGNVLEKVSCVNAKDGQASVGFGESYGAGSYILRFTAEKSRTYFVLASAAAPSSGAVAKISVGGGVLTNSNTKEAPYIRLIKYTPAEIKRSSFNTVMLDDSMLCDCGDAEAWIKSNPVSFEQGMYSSLTLRGWAYCTKSIKGFGYRIDGGDTVKGSFGETRNDVKSVINAAAEGYRVIVPVGTLDGGKHTVEVIVITSDNYENVVCSFEINLDTETAPAVILKKSFNEITLGTNTLCRTADAEAWAKNNPISFSYGSVSALTLEGWTYLNHGIREFIYRIDGGRDVHGSFIANRPDVKSMIGKSAEGFSVSADVSKVAAGAHIIDVYAVAASGEALPAARLKFTVTESALGTRDAMPDTWVATDALGRTLPTNEETGDLREGKYIGLFFWTWHCGQSANNPANNELINEQYPDSINNYYDPVWAAAGTDRYHWNEPIYGYYNGLDPWVYRRQAEMLANSGVDVIFFDNTNGTYTWEAGYMMLCQVFEQARAQGVNTPKIAFFLPFSDGIWTKTQLRELYSKFYAKGLYQDLWFYWDGKPLIISYSGSLNRNDSLEGAIADFFTFREGEPVYNSAREITAKRWTWLSNYPQAVTYRADGSAEHMTVGVAQNWSYISGKLTAMNGVGIQGRSYTSKGIDTRENSKLYGANFEEQFEYALDIDPDFIFITGWNEWIALRNKNWNNVNNAFADQFNDEYSRDIEPSKGDLGDNYYYQLVSFVRRYKGTRAVPAASGEKTIDITAGKSQWKDVSPEYIAYVGNTFDRSCKGYGSTYYTDTTGRNDIKSAKTARDSENIYFMCECAGNITPYTANTGWMRLYLDTAESGSSAWNTFEYIVEPRGNGIAYVKACASDGRWSWTKIGEVRYTVDGNMIQIEIPRALIGLDGSGFTVNFKWSDNTCINGDIMDFYVHGDVAPGGRFKYQYNAD